MVCSVAKKERKRRWRKSARGIAYNRKAAALYRTRYPDRVRAAKARHHKTNSDHILRKVAEWQKANPDKTRTYKANNKAARKGAVGRHSPREIQELFLRQRGLCAICVIDISGKYHRDHIVPLSKGGSNFISNIQLLCPPCNLHKHAKNNDDFIRERSVP